MISVVGLNYINNIVTNVRSHGYVTIGGNAGHIDSVVIRNNISFNNARSNDISFENGASAPAHYNHINPIKRDPKLNTDFTLKTGSPAIDAGFDVGFPYHGSAPDIGAFETGAGANLPPTANAGADKTITLPTNTHFISGEWSRQRWHDCFLSMDKDFRSISIQYCECLISDN